MKKTLVLLILDGWGIGKDDHTNPVFAAKPKTIDHLKTNYLAGALQASGIAVGLPWNEEGNSEVGHLTIGAGTVIYQHYPRITLSIRDGSFFKNSVLKQAFDHAKKNAGGVNLVGLLTEGNIHASLEHVRALIGAAKQQDVTDLKLHLFTDGKDSGPRSALALITKVEELLREAGIGVIASISGRFYGLDRDGHWERTRQAYRALTGDAPVTEDIAAHLQKAYDKGLSDDFIEPCVVGSTPRPIRARDAVIFFDFREDSVRQIAGSFILPDFTAFARAPLADLFVATMTEYAANFAVPVIFPPQKIEHCLGRAIADAGMVQLRIAETEKYAHVTFFFNGLRDEPFANEFRVLIPSKSVARYDLVPEMMTREVSARVIEAVAEGTFDFILANFAASDMIAHTGNFDSAVAAITAIDEELAKILAACEERGCTLVIASDHGNVERMIDPFTGRAQTGHDTDLVPLYVVGPLFKRRKTPEDAALTQREAAGFLSDVAPTVLELLGIPKPAEMTGESLLRRLQ